MEQTADRKKTKLICTRALTPQDRKSTRLNSSHSQNSYAVFCLKKNSTPNARDRGAASEVLVAPPFCRVPRSERFWPYRYLTIYARFPGFAIPTMTVVTPAEVAR